jgi:alpha-glucosidase
VELPTTLLQDPMHYRSGGVDPGRDGCRVPLPWRGTAAPFGFSPAQASSAPWLPQPDDWTALTVEAQEADPASMLRLYREALRIRRREEELGDGTLTWLDDAAGGGSDVLAFTRGERFLCVTNLSATAVELPEHDSILLTSTPLDGGLLPTDSTAWLRITPS